MLTGVAENKFHGNERRVGEKSFPALVVCAHGRLNEMCQQADGRPAHE